ncbi:hypothetical protein DVH05_025609 [Phytophthora capsici]|nr:hypothetical protein DVH05_025609 [Phytophthora capsici]
MEPHGEEVKLAERFKKSGVKHFRKTDEFGKRILYASANYNCGFNVLNTGARVIGRPNLIPEDVVDSFSVMSSRKVATGCKAVPESSLQR